MFNNYFSLGIDAHIALQFHNARNANSDKFTSRYGFLYLNLYLLLYLHLCICLRTRNLLFYGLEGGKDLVVHKWRHLMDSVKVICTMIDGQKVSIVTRTRWSIIILVIIISFIHHHPLQVDVTERLKSYGAHALLFLNIRRYHHHHQVL